MGRCESRLRGQTLVGQTVPTLLRLFLGALQDSRSTMYDSSAETESLG